MIALLLLVVALVLFVIAALAPTAVAHAVVWGLAALTAALIADHAGAGIAAWRNRG